MVSLYHQPIFMVTTGGWWVYGIAIWTPEVRGWINKLCIYNRSTISMGQFPVHYVNVYQRDGLYCGKAMAQVSSILMLTMAVGMDGGIDLPRSLWILPFLADFLLKNYQLRFLQTSYSKSFFSCHKSMIFKFVQRVKAHLFSGKLLFSAGSHFS